MVRIDPKTLRFHYADHIEPETIKLAQNLFTIVASKALVCGPRRV